MRVRVLVLCTLHRCRHLQFDCGMLVGETLSHFAELSTMRHVAPRHKCQAATTRRHILFTTDGLIRGPRSLPCAHAELARPRTSLLTHTCGRTGTGARWARTRARRPRTTRLLPQFAQLLPAPPCDRFVAFHETRLFSVPNGDQQDGLLDGNRLMGRSYMAD